jgi:hypothetical protein
MYEKITLCRKLRDGNPCSNDQSGGLKHTGKMAFWEIKGV